MKSKINNRIYLKKKKKLKKLFSGIIKTQCQEQEPAPAPAESKRRAPEENSFSDNLMGKGPVKARSLSITTIIIIVGSSCRTRAV